MRRRSQNAALILVLCATLLAACEQEDDAPRSITDGSWRLTSGIETVPGYPIVISFGVLMPTTAYTYSDRGVTGISGCNQYGGFADLGTSTFALRRMFTNLVGCTGAVLEAEEAYRDALLSVDHYSLEEDELVLRGPPDVELRFAWLPPVPREEVLEVVWTLEHVIGEDGSVWDASDQATATLILQSDGTFDAHSGCRTYTGTWRADGAVLRSLSSRGEGECPPELTEQDRRYPGLDQALVSVEPGRLTLTRMGGGGALVFPAGDRSSGPAGDPAISAGRDRSYCDRQAVERERDRLLDERAALAASHPDLGTEPPPPPFAMNPDKEGALRETAAVIAEGDDRDVEAVWAEIVLQERSKYVSDVIREHYPAIWGGREWRFEPELGMIVRLIGPVPAGLEEWLGDLLGDDIVIEGGRRFTREEMWLRAGAVACVLVERGIEADVEDDGDLLHATIHAGDEFEAELLDAVRSDLLALLGPELGELLDGDLTLESPDPTAPD